MIEFSQNYGFEQTNPDATFKIPLDTIEKACLSVAFRTARNRTALYQKKHAGATLTTRTRDPELAALNRPISEHYQFLCSREGSLQDRRMMAFAISDLTANPLRPHYDNTIPPDKRIFHSKITQQAADRNGSDAYLFYLEDEPIGKVPYTLLISYEKEARTRFAIYHEVKVIADGSLPDKVPEEIRKGLKWWAACPPILIDGQHNPEQYTILDYDLRHVFGFAEKDSSEEKALRDIYQLFPEWEAWSDAIRQKLTNFKSWASGYHAALGISQGELFLVHRIATIPELAEELKKLGAEEAILLDSGGSCVLWANWLNGNQGGVLANHWNFRPHRGAVIFVVLKGKRYPEYVVRSKRA